ncbi:MAG: Asp-tRNA(Asn)/Glu-tRNA(Gln) amidotransferase subunit GatA [Gemmatimonadota bacterium]|nr:Asp-tRNA(Asn)/Glu-tRNA(Gln) amidotransferase subunit GatA [Gemmatimonadota bacterium]
MTHDAGSALARIAESEAGPGGLNAFLSLADADDVQPRANGPLAGAPVAVKDNISTTALPTTCGSRLLDGYQAPYEATVVRKLRDAGGVVIGKTNLDEFGMGSSTENSAYGPTLNPHDRSRVPGGSSGGSAAAIAAGYTTMALGSDTGGSVRQPASFCGVVGIKPTYGRVSRYGLAAFASSLDQVGVLGRTVTDAATLLGAISGHDPHDATTADTPVPDYADDVGRGVAGMVVGVPAEYFPDALDPAIRSLLESGLERLVEAGARLEKVSLAHTSYAIPAYYLLAPAEASSNLARYDGVRFGVRQEGSDIASMYEKTRRGFGDEVKRRIMLGTYALSAGYYDEYYGTAQRARSLITQDFAEVFARVDVLFTPTAPTTAFSLGERTGDPLAMYMSDVFTVTANLAGIPGVSVPVGYVDGLPVGGQLLAPWWGESTMLAAAGAVEASSPGSLP